MGSLGHSLVSETSQNHVITTQDTFRVRPVGHDVTWKQKDSVHGPLGMLISRPTPAPRVSADQGVDALFWLSERLSPTHN